MAPQKGRSWRLAKVWPEPCTMPMGTCIGMTMLGSALVAPGRGDSIAGWSLRDTSWEILTYGCRSKGGSHSVIPDDKKLTQE